MRLALLIFAALLLAGCGGEGRSVVNKTPIPIPRYPGAASAKVTANPTFASTDWMLPRGTRPSVVYDWYTQHLRAKGWKITNRNETGLRATKLGRSISLGVRGRTLEVISS